MAIDAGKAGPIAEQSAGHDLLAQHIDRRQRIARRQCRELMALIVEECPSKQALPPRALTCKWLRLSCRRVDLWLDRLNDGGRLILMLTLDKKFGRAGAFFRIERRGDGFLAKWIFAGDIFPCEGARDAESERALVAALEKGGQDRVTRLLRRGDLPDEQCWLKGPDWCLVYD